MCCGALENNLLTADVWCVNSMRYVVQIYGLIKISKKSGEEINFPRFFGPLFSER